MPNNPSQQNPPHPTILEREFLPVRAKILEIAAALDRIQRVGGKAQEDPRWKQLQTAIQTLLEPEADRAERIQLLFSRAYDDHWRSAMDLSR